jgi:cysteine desulfurase
MKNSMVYLDNNATTPLAKEVQETLIKALTDYGNPSSLHQLGRQMRDAIEEARYKVASFLGAEAKEIIFVGSGSEANNAVLSSLNCPKLRKNLPKASLITSQIEHPCILEASKYIEETGLHVDYLPVDRDGRIDMQAYTQCLNKNTALVSIMLANNEIGTMQDIQKLAALAHEKGTLFHTDAVQAVGKIPVNVHELGVDYLTMSAHKIYGPKGVGALYIKKGSRFCPLIRGGHQEAGRRAGTENVWGILGFAKAVELRQKEMVKEMKKLTDLNNYLRQRIEKEIPEIYFNSPKENCLPNTLNVSFYRAEGESILLYLDLAGIAVSTGSACASRSLNVSHVLQAIQTPEDAGHGSIRISMGKYTTKKDLAYLMEKLKETIARVRNISTR